ncbi:hypothetical protein BAR24066_02730 [Burkholderia arboris]|uniref:Fimbrial assembly protein n=1 Tax=Burkholderia arboris TaxID=488730 RepID=A0A9Q9SHT1_9BURK|nr:hypothetical protein [Burkholderia arboris]VWB59150.1 hypothetical protein BAR24066_02730 [Burkholderia arboris]
MKQHIWGCLLAASACLPMCAAAQEIKGKTVSKVTARVVRADNLIVTDDKGGWFGSGLTMQQLGGWDTAYEVQARLRVVSTTGRFRVRMDEPLDIRTQAKPAVVFRSPAVSLGAEGAERKPLVVGHGVDFQNPAAPLPNVDSEGYYNLAVSAYPPVGDFKSTAGTYTGTLSLVFEPLVAKP